MLKTRLLHPEILRALGEAGHGSQVLIADGNYAMLTGSNAAACRVYLNLAPGLVTVTDVLDVLIDVIPIEAAHVMLPETGPEAGPEAAPEPGIFAEFRARLPGIPLQPLARPDFYSATRRPDLALAISTGEQRLYANLLLTIGVVQPE